MGQLHVNVSYPVCQKSREPSEPPLANRPSWTGCQATAEDRKTAAPQCLLHHCVTAALSWSTNTVVITYCILCHYLWTDLPVASFLCPLKTCSSSFRFLMSNSLHRWSRDAVSSQLPFRFHFTSITVFLWA